MRGRSVRLAFIGVACAFALASAVALAQPQRPASADARQPAASGDDALVEVAPIRCWWRASAGAIVIGETFDVRLTCAVLENESVQVIPDESTLAPSGVQLPPFEMVSGDRPSDTRAGQRRFFQYRYTLRLVDPNEIGQDVSLPRLPITYKVQSRVAANATLAGRDFTYMMPDVTLKVVSLVPEDATDIRDSSDVGLERLDALVYRGRVANITAVALFAAGVLMSVLAAAAVVERARPSARRERAPLSDYATASAIARELARVAHESASGWTPELVSAGHAALRLLAALLLDRPLSERHLHRTAHAANDRLAVRSRLPWSSGVSLASPLTAADLSSAIATMPPGTDDQRRTSLERVRDSLATFTRYRYAAAENGADSAALSNAIEAARVEARHLVRQRRWRWRSRPQSDAAVRQRIAGL